MTNRFFPGIYPDQRNLVNTQKKKKMIGRQSKWSAGDRESRNDLILWSRGVTNLETS